MAQKTQTTFKGVVLLLLTALIWGISFVSQQEGMKNVDAFTFNGVRTVLGAAVLIPFILMRDYVTGKQMTEEQIQHRKKTDRRTIIYGTLLGVVLCAATNLQQFAFYYSDAGKIAFITAMYMFFVPLFGLFFRKRIPIITWICVVLGFVGLYFLCIPSSPFAEIASGGLNKGNMLALACAVFFTIQIMLIEKFAPDCDGIKLSCVQFASSGIISIVLMFIFEHPQWSAIKQAAIPILYSGIMSCGFAYTFQILGQKHCEATIASLLMCMESVFAVLASAILLHQVLSLREILGCSIMFGAILVSQVSDIIKARNSDNGDSPLVEGVCEE